jgi:hypothetical protein
MLSLLSPSILSEGREALTDHDAILRATTAHTTEARSKDSRKYPSRFLLNSGQGGLVAEQIWRSLCGKRVHEKISQPFWIATG